MIIKTGIEAVSSFRFKRRHSEISSPASSGRAEQRPGLAGNFWALPSGFGFDYFIVMRGKGIT